MASVNQQSGVCNEILGKRPTSVSCLEITATFRPLAGGLADGGDDAAKVAASRNACNGKLRWHFMTGWAQRRGKNADSHVERCSWDARHSDVVRGDERWPSTLATISSDQRSLRL
ncbi:hypothetical protein PG994_006239 [Apiospora phragmitis]|uniref:Uncharacterized protein n=1 Tax=Apiospora phragmitis TaxID=2905665 RepID=A0ABR1VEK3_9PEZI